MAQSPQEVVALSTESPRSTVVSMLPSPRRVGLTGPMPWRLSTMTCPSVGLRLELQQSRKVSCVDRLLGQVREDSRRHFAQSARLQLGMDRMLEVIDSATYDATAERRGCRTIRHGVSSPGSEMSSAFDEDAHQVLNEVLLRATATMETTPESGNASLGADNGPGASPMGPGLHGRDARGRPGAESAASPRSDFPR
mmetsp:Transcript_21410/g.47464  ORF Transcript_21410/g.47464 Transcript_21410/m.47464 type:complete len:196 (-) Transcript_21410:144-731(-)